MEQAILENLRQGHSIQAACAAAGCTYRTYHRFATGSPAHRHDRAVAIQEAERRLVGVVLDSVSGGDVGSAKWLLERRWPHVYGALQRLEATVDADHRVDVEVLALAERFSNLDDAQVEGELQRLAWVTEQPTIPSPAPAEADSIMGGEGAAIALPAQQSVGGSMAGLPPPTPHPAAADSTAQVARDDSNGTMMPTHALAPLQAPEHPEPVPCAHCRGLLGGKHEPGCPSHTEDGLIKIHPFAFGDPR